VRKYMTLASRRREYRLRLFHALRDLTADPTGLAAGHQHAGGGGLYAQRIVTRKHFDMAAAKDAALRYVGLNAELSGAGRSRVVSGPNRVLEGTASEGQDQAPGARPACMR